MTKSYLQFGHSYFKQNEMGKKKTDTVILGEKDLWQHNTNWSWVNNPILEYINRNAICKNTILVLYSATKSCVYVQFKKNALPVFTITDAEIWGSSFGIDFLGSICVAFVSTSPFLDNTLLVSLVSFCFYCWRILPLNP